MASKNIGEKMDGATRNLESDNISALAAAFPEVVADGKVDFEKLRLILGEDIDDSEERYSFNWPGKRDAIKMAISRTTGTLRPDKENSKDWDTTQNMFIEGDNLEVLRSLQNSYRGKVKMIYIDPPYNTGKDFVYKDDFKDNIRNYKENASLEGQSNPDTAGRYHTNWLNMMYPRLRLAKNLLKDDGVIFISIDDNEVHNLRKICDEIFGDTNFLASLIWNTNHSAQAGIFKVYHQYVLVYARRADLIKVPGSQDNEVFYAGAQKRQSARHPVSEFTFPAGVKIDAADDAVFGTEWGEAEKTILTKGEIVIKNGALQNSVTLKAAWTQKNQMQEFFYGDRESLVDSRGQKIVDFFFNSTGKLKIGKSRGVLTPPTVRNEYGSQNAISNNLAELFSTSESPLNNPKPVCMIEEFNGWFVKEDDLVVDFFAGSATSAHATMRKNAEDGGSRKFIMVQIPEATPENSEARKAKYNTISEISRKRIDLAGEKIKEDYKDKLAERETPLDVGFKAFTLDTTNFREWDTNTTNIEQSLLDALDTFKEGRNEEDALYEVLLKYGVDITEPVEVLTLAGSQVYSLAGNYLLVCLEKSITLETIEAMASLKPERVVCYDDGFADEDVKQNSLETLKRAGVTDVRVV